MTDSIDDVCKSWERLLDPKTLRANLISASLFVTAYETLCDSVIENPKSFYHLGFDDSGDKISPEYVEDVLSKSTKGPLAASLLWFRERDAINDDDIKVANELRMHRNEITHELPEFVFRSSREVNRDLLNKLLELLAKIDRWWIREIEIPTGAVDDVDPDSIRDEEITSGRMMMLSMMFHVATASDEEASKHLDEFRRARDEVKSSMQSCRQRQGTATESDSK